MQSIFNQTSAGYVSILFFTGACPFSPSEDPAGVSEYNYFGILNPDQGGARFTNGFSIAIQIRWKFRFTITSILLQWSLQNFVHGTTAVLSWHVQKIVAI